ncbi:MAG: hypothetical protein AAF449_25405, partial [Myxococcota bacterium]
PPRLRPRRRYVWSAGGRVMRLYTYDDDRRWKLLETLDALGEAATDITEALDSAAVAAAQSQADIRAARDLIQRWSETIDNDRRAG